MYCFFGLIINPETRSSQECSWLNTSPNIYATDYTTINEQQGRNINMHISGTSALQRGCAKKSLLHTRVILSSQMTSATLRWPLQGDEQRHQSYPSGFHFVPPDIRGSDASPARWCVWISSRPVRVLRDLRSLKATTGTMSSSLVSTSCDVFVPTGSLAASSMVPLCTGCVFSFGWASFGKAFADSDRCVKKELISLVEDLLFDFRSIADACQWILDMRHESPEAMSFLETEQRLHHIGWICSPGSPHDLLKPLQKKKAFVKTCVSSIRWNLWY